MKITDKKSKAALLRKKAESLRNNKTAQQPSPLAEADTKKLIHELEVHQIELEMQNEELMRTQSAARDLAGQFIELYDFSPSGYVTLTKAGEIHQVNIACARMLGKERSQLIHHPFRAFISSDTQQVYDSFVQNVIGNKASAACEAALLTSGNSPTFVEMTGILSSDHRHLLITLVDITGRKEMDQLIRDVQRREAIGVLSAGIAHDFNNLLSVMMGNVSLARTKLSSDHPAYKHMEKAELAMVRAAELTNQILAYSGKGKNQIEKVDLGEEIRQHVSLFTITMPKNVKLITHLPSTPVRVCGDPGQIKQIIMNLISNGADAIGEKQGEVSITLYETMLDRAELSHYGLVTNTFLNEGKYALLEIRDSGMGMSKETLANIFDPFFTTKFTGRGLGLSAVLGIIRGHEGGISIETAEGRGSVFRVILPVCGEDETKRAEESEPFAPIAREKMTILVIDDEPDVAEMAKDVLETADYTVIAELDPRRGIELYRQHKADIGAVLLDWTMPEISGKEVAAALAGIDPSVKIIISSGYSAHDIGSQIDTATISGFLHKPYTLQSLLAMVRDVMK